jgi:hypothetical protein
MESMARRTALRLLAPLLIGVAGASSAGLLLARAGPPALLTVGLAAPRASGWLRGADRPSRATDVQLVLGSRRIQADRYEPEGRPRGGIVLVHGLSAAGRRHPELVRLASLLQGRGQTVLVPQLEGLAAYRLDGAEVEAIVTAIRDLAGRGLRPAVAGFSFGAGPALLAAAAAPGVRVAASFGGYADLRRVITFVATGLHEFGGRRYHAAQEEYNRWKLLALLAGFPEDERDRSLLAAIAARRLASPLADTSPLEARLGPAGHAILAAVQNRRPEEAEKHLDRLPPEARQMLARLSPLGAVASFRGRLLVAHGASDRSIPFTESLHLAAAAAPGRARLVILETFDHTGPRRAWAWLGATVRDAWGLFRLADDLLSP